MYQKIMTGLFFHFRISKCLSKNSVKNWSSVSYLVGSDFLKNPLSDNQKMNILQMNNLMEIVANSYEEMLINELLKECQIKKKILLRKERAKELIVTSDIKTLKELKFLPKNVNIFKNLLAQLEQFPFEPPKSTYRFENSIKSLRDMIEKQYLAWKLNVDINVINQLYICYKKYLIVGRSLQSCQRNINLINAVPSLRSQSVGNKIYLLNMRPFFRNSLMTFNNNLLGMNWDKVGLMYPNLMKKTYYSIMLIVNTLKMQGFSRQQIKFALPYIKGELNDFLERLNYILSHPHCSSFKNHPKFLRLLHFNHAELQNLKDQDFKSFSAILKLIQMRSRKKKKMSVKEFMKYLQKLFQIEDVALEDFKRCLNERKVHLETVCSTLKYLRKKRFSNCEILESLQVILYPKVLIENCLKNVIMNESLNELGFDKGCVQEETHLFSKGTKSKNKRLQLCLYYLQKSEDFSLKKII